VSLERLNRYLAENPYRNPWVGLLGPLEAVGSLRIPDR
jgi:hypothetical protein